MSSMKKLAAALLALCLLLPGMSVFATNTYANELLMAADWKLDEATLEENGTGSVTLKSDITVDFGGYMYTSDENAPVITVADGVNVTLNNGVIVAKGDSPAIVLGKGATLTLIDTIVVGAVVKDLALLTSAVVAGEGATVVVNSSAVVGSYGVEAEGKASVKVNDSIVLGTVAAASETVTVTTDADYKMVDVGDYLKDRLGGGETVTAVMDYILTGKAIVSVTALSSVVEYEVSKSDNKEKPNLITFTAEEIASKYPKMLNYVWVPYTVTVGDKVLPFDAKYEAKLEVTNDELDAGITAYVDFKLVVTLSAYAQSALNRIPGLLERLATKLENLEVVSTLFNKIDATVTPMIDQYTALYDDMAEQILGVSDLLNENTAKLEDAKATLKEAMDRLNGAYGDIEDAVQDAWDTFEEELEKAKAEAREEFDRQVAEKLAEAKAEFDAEVAEKLAEALDEFNNRKQEELDKAQAEFDQKVQDKIDELEGELEDRLLAEVGKRLEAEVAEIQNQVEIDFAAYCEANNIDPASPVAQRYYTQLVKQAEKEIENLVSEYEEQIEQKKQEAMAQVRAEMQEEIDAKYAEAEAEFNARVAEKLAEAQAEFDAKVEEKLEEANRTYEEKVAEKLAEAEQEFNDKVAEEEARIRAEIEDKINNERAKYETLLRDLEMQVMKASMEMDRLEKAVFELEHAYYALVATYDEVGAHLDAVVALYNSLNADSNFTMWVVDALPVLAEHLNGIENAVASILAQLNEIRDYHLPNITGAVDNMMAIVETISEMLESDDYQEMMETAGVEFTFDVTGFDYDLSGMESTLVGAIDTVADLKDTLASVSEPVNNLIENDKYQKFASIIKNYDPETVTKNTLKKLLNKGPAVIAQLIADETYFAEKYVSAKNLTIEFTDKVIAKYPAIKAKVLAAADTFLTADNVKAFKASAEKNFAEAIAKYPAAAEYFFDLLEKGVEKYPAAQPELEALADKLVALVDAKTASVERIVDAIVLGYVNPFLHGKPVATITGETVVTIQQKSPATGDATISIAILAASAAVALGAVYTVDKKRK